MQQGLPYSTNPHNVENISEPEDRGVASLGYNEHSYLFCSVLKWPLPFLQKFGSNSTLLEIIGFLLPFMCIPGQLRHTHVLLLVDNQAVVYAWRKQMSPHCEYVYLITQTLHLIEAMLPCRIYVKHILRCSSPQSILVDQLSRTSTTHERVLQEIRHLWLHTPASPLAKWLEDPTADWKLPKHIADYVINDVLPPQTCKPLRFS
jgi:hypothetical protein